MILIIIFHDYLPIRRNETTVFGFFFFGSNEKLHSPLGLLISGIPQKGLKPILFARMSEVLNPAGFLLCRVCRLSELISKLS